MRSEEIWKAEIESEGKEDGLTILWYDMDMERNALMNDLQARG
jgi:hypothetical protein